MELQVSTDPAEIIGLLEPLLAADPVRHNVLGSIVAGLRGPDADGWCAHPVGEPAVLAIRSQRHTPIGLTAGWTDVTALAAELVRLPVLTELGGPPTETAALAGALGRHGRVESGRVRLRLFRLDALVEPAGVAGAARLATEADIALLTGWFSAFSLETHGHLPAGVDPAAVVTHGVQNLRTWVWTDAAGAPAAMAVARPPANGVARIGPVYTPPEQRGHGYGSAATASATREVLDRAVPVLYADQDSPTPNRIYQRLGYRSVEDRLAVFYR